jgi:hypothetical protein
MQASNIIILYIIILLANNYRNNTYVYNIIIANKIIMGHVLCC